MRAYFFGNLYLSSIQQGIQSQHCTVEMYNKYFTAVNYVGEVCFDANQQTMHLSTWAHDHKTDILLNGGYSSTLHEIYDVLEDTDNPYPYAKFHESEEALDGALTCVGIILPEEIYEVAKEVREARGQDKRLIVSHFNMHGEWNAKFDDNGHTFTKFQVWLINEINKYGLAR